MSAVGNSFSWNATDFGALGVYVTNAEEEYIPTPRMTVTQLSGADGAMTHGRTFGPRRFTLDCTLVAANRAGRDNQMDDVVAALLETESGEKNFSRDNIVGKTWQTRLVGEPVIGEKTDTSIAFQLTMIAPNPWATSVPITQLQAIHQTPQTFTLQGLGGRVSSNQQTVWIFKNGSVSVDFVTMKYTQGESSTQIRTFTWANTLLANQWLRLTKKTGIAELSINNGASWTTNNANMTGRIPLIFIGSNDYTSSGIKTGTIQVTYTPEFR